jgi:hypothetical protein
MLLITRSNSGFFLIDDDDDSDGDGEAILSDELKQERTKSMVRQSRQLPMVQLPVPLTGSGNHMSPARVSPFPRVGRRPGSLSLSPQHNIISSKPQTQHVCLWLCCTCDQLRCGVQTRPIQRQGPLRNWRWLRYRKRHGPRGGVCANPSELHILFFSQQSLIFSKIR